MELCGLAIVEKICIRGSIYISCIKLGGMKQWRPLPEGGINPSHCYSMCDMCLYSFYPAQNGISIYSLPSPLYYRTGSIFSITCQFPTSLTFDSFTHVNHGIISVSQGRFMLEHYNDQVLLHISDAQEIDGGDYICVLSECVQ